MISIFSDTTMNDREEKLLREYIRLNLNERALLSEGLSSILTKALQSALNRIQDVIDRLQSIVPASNRVMTALEKSGAGDFVSKVEVMGQDLESSLNAVSDAVPAKIGESRRRTHTRYSVYRRPTITEDARARRALNEVAFGGFEIVGIALAILGGTPLLLKVLKKLAGFLGFDGAAEKLNVAYEKMHHIEETVIDYVIADKALYAVYLAIEEEKNPEEFANLMLYQSDPSDLGGRSFRSTHKRAPSETGERTGKFKRTISGQGLKRTMTFEEFVESQDKQKYEKRTWALVLIPWLYAGLMSLHHVFTGMLGAIEGAATGVKAIEVGTAAAEVAPSIAAEIGSAVSALVKA